MNTELTMISIDYEWMRMVMNIIENSLFLNRVFIVFLERGSFLCQLSSQKKGVIMCCFEFNYIAEILN